MSTRVQAVPRTGTIPGGLLLPIVALGVFALFVGATLAVAGDTLGYDFLAYRAAADRILHGQALYDTSYTAAGGFGLFYYPPPFVLLALPFALLPASAATWLWIGVLGACMALGTAVLPVSRSVRWTIVLLAGLSWPVAYAFKLGQVGPILYLAFAVGWRWLDRPGPLGLSAAVGTIIKLQPGIVIAWCAIVGRWRAVAVAVVALAVAAVLATLAAGFGAWTDYVSLLRGLADPITTDHNFTPGAIAFQAGIPAAQAALVQLVSSVGVVALVLAGIRWARPEASYLSLIPASQLISPVLWDHYALLLLIPVAWLLGRRQWWAALVPLATITPLVGITPPVAYPAAFAVTLVGVLIVGLRTDPSGEAVAAATESARWS